MQTIKSSNLKGCTRSFKHCTKQHDLWQSIPGHSLYRRHDRARLTFNHITHVATYEHFEAAYSRLLKLSILITNFGQSVIKLGDDEHTLRVYILYGFTSISRYICYLNTQHKVYNTLSSGKIYLFWYLLLFYCVKLLQQLNVRISTFLQQNWTTILKC